MPEPGQCPNYPEMGGCTYPAGHEGNCGADGPFPRQAEHSEEKRAADRPLSWEELHAGFAWIRQQAAEAGDRLAPLYLTLGWHWQDLGPPSPGQIRTTILKIIDDLTKTLTEESQRGAELPYAAYSRSGGLEVGVARMGELGTPSAFIRFVQEVAHTIGT